MAIYETLRTGGQQWQLHAEPDCEQCRFQARLRNRAEVRRWLQQFKGDALCMGEFRRLLARESDVNLRLDRASEDAVLDQVARMFETGRWLLHDPGHVHGRDTQNLGSKGKSAPAGASGSGRASLLSEPRAAKSAPPAAPSKSAALTWIEIRLVNADGEPMGGVAYELKLPDGTLKSDKLDDTGKARYDDIVAGQCEVRFPELDGGDWKPA